MLQDSIARNKFLLDAAARGKIAVGWCDTPGKEGEEYRQRVIEVVQDLLDIPH